MKQIVCDACGGIIPSRSLAIRLVGRFTTPHPMGGTTSEYRKLDLCSRDCLERMSRDLVVK